MVPYSFVFLIFWILLLVVWLLLGIQLGPDAGIHYIMPN
jgi:aminobenzoyl-glutamate transport protein